MTAHLQIPGPGRPPLPEPPSRPAAVVWVVRLFAPKVVLYVLLVMTMLSGESLSVRLTALGGVAVLLAVPAAAAAVGAVHLYRGTGRRLLVGVLILELCLGALVAAFLLLGALVTSANAPLSWVAGFVPVLVCLGAVLATSAGQLWLLTRRSVAAFLAQG